MKDYKWGIQLLLIGPIHSFCHPMAAAMRDLGMSREYVDLTGYSLAARSRLALQAHQFALGSIKINMLVSLLGCIQLL